MPDYDAIVIGAGHNGLTAAAILQRGGLKTLCLEKNHYSGGMAATVELFDGFQPPKTLDGMFACASNEAERIAIHEMMFGSCMDVIAKYFPDKEKHRMLRGMLAFLAVNSTYRGPYTPGSAMCLAFALATHSDIPMMKKLDGGIGALAKHIQGIFESQGGELPLKTKVARIIPAG